MRKLVHARSELQALLLFCRTPELAGEMMNRIHCADFFATEWARETYERIIDSYRNMQVSDGVLPFSSLLADTTLKQTTVDRLESGYRTLKDAAIDKELVINNLTRLRKLRRLNELSERINNALTDEAVEPDEIIKLSEEFLGDTKVTGVDMGKCLFHLGTSFNMKGVVANILSDDVKQFVPTGIEEFDKRNGGVNYGSLMVIGGTTGGGKSLAAAQVTMNMAMYEDVCMVPLEMSVSEHVSRMMSNLGDVDIHKITGKSWSKEEKDRSVAGLKAYHTKVKQQGNRYSVFRPEADMSIEEIFAALHSYDYRVICIDYIGLLKGADEDDQARMLSRIARCAKVYAATHNKIVILLAQVNEEGKVKYSRAIAEHANNMWTFVATEHTKKEGIIEVKQPKARNQDPTPFVLTVDYAKMRIDGCHSIDSVAIAGKREPKKETAAEKKAREKEEHRIKNDSARGRTRDQIAKEIHDKKRADKSYNITDFEAQYVGLGEYRMPERT